MLKKYFLSILFIFLLLIYWVSNDLNLIWKDYFSVNFFDMKLWDWILIKTPNDKIILIDWWIWDQMISKISKRMWFFERKIDYVFISHYDSDHLSWLLSVLKKFEIWEIFMLKIEKKTYLFRELINIINEKDIDIKFYSDLDSSEKTWNFYLDENLFFKKIFPDKNDIIAIIDKMKNGSLNKIKNYASVFELEIWKSKTKFLFTWDIEKKIEKYLVENKKIEDIDYLKIPHHWSKTSSSTWFILITKPEFWIIMAAEKNKFHHPSEEIVERYDNLWVKLFQTGKLWGIEFRIY